MFALNTGNQSDEFRGSPNESRRRRRRRHLRTLADRAKTRTFLPAAALKVWKERERERDARK